MTLLLQSDKSPKGVPLTDLEISWMASLPYIVSVPSTYIMAEIGDRYGRKLALLLATGSAAATWLLKLCSMSIWAFIAARILVGITMSGSCVICPTYIKEICDSNIRGALGCWDASKSLIWLRCKSKYDSTIKEEIDYIKEEHEKDEGQGPFLVMKILSNNILRRAFYISLVITLSRELCGLVQITTFAGDIFQLTVAQSIIKLSPNQKAIVTGFVQLCGVTLASVLIERCGRKPLIFIMSFISGLSMCVLATWFLLQHFNPPGYIPVISLCICIFCDNSGTLPLSLVLTGEMFSFKYRGTVLATTMSVACIVNFIQLLFFKSIIKVMGIYFVFYFFGAVCLFTAVYVMIMLPETRNRKLEDIYYDLSTSKEKMELGDRNTVSIPAFSYGNSIGWMSPMTLLLQSPESPKGVPLTDLEVSCMASLPYVVCIPGTYLMAAIGDRYGRKLALLTMSVTSITIWLLKLCSMNIWVFILARMLVGITMSGACVTCPTYIKEISDNDIRGALGCWGTIFFTMGCLFSYIIGDLCSYRLILLILLLVPVSHFVIFLTMPESPSYLLKKGKDEEASKVLMWLRCRKEYDLAIKEEIEYIKEEQKKDEHQAVFLLKNIGKDNILRRAFYISLVAAMSRELCGSVPILIFAGYIFKISSEGTGIELSPNQSSMVLGAVQLLGATLVSAIVERFGRKPLLLATCLLSGTSLCILASWFVFQNFDPPSWIPVTTLCIVIFCDSCGLLPLTLVLTSEIFSYKYRGIVLATTMALASIADFFQLILFKFLIKVTSACSVFYIYGVISILTAVYVFIKVPETRNRQLEDIYYDLKTKKEKRQLETVLQFRPINITNNMIR
ncbi:unnamed protein product [Danaus chrysippus]|uniref:(African queen) hypothetical protein n=1 Tax=Danaus chrysippus TaxID=151541 RepID=A0A8J2VWU4_9NEOP|nr:unnamed protein product [Danaus chrysippus]